MTATSGRPSSGPRQLRQLEGDRRSRTRKRAGRLFERAGYLSELRLLFTNDWQHSVGPIVVESRVGMGKTAFIGAACQLAVDSGWVVLRARGEPCKVQVPAYILGRLLDCYAPENSSGAAQDDGPAATTLKLDALVRRLSVEQGVVVCIDDGQWCDEDSSAWIHGLGPWPLKQRFRLIIGMATRPPGQQLRTLERVASEPSARVMSPSRERPSACSPTTISTPLLSATLFAAAMRQRAVIPRLCSRSSGSFTLKVFAPMRVRWRRSRALRPQPLRVRC